MKYFSMFSGIGGFELGIQRAFDNEHAHIGEESEPQERPQGRERSTHKQGLQLHDRNGSTPLCVGYSEIDKYAIKVYERRFNGNSVGTQQGQQEEQRGEVRDKVPYETDSGNTQRAIGQSTGLYNRGRHHNYGDATTINPKELPDFDLLVGGFPCQAFSVAGKRAGFNDTRGTLFFDIARILKEKQPRHLVLENVKGLLSHDQGRTFTTIIGVLTDLGYSVEWQVLNSKDFGVPQNRERVFIVGHLRGECERKVLPIGQANGTINARYEPVDTKSEVASTVRSRYGNGTGSHIKQLNQPTHSNDRVYGDDGISPTLNTMQGGARQPFVAPVLTPDRPEKRQNGRRFKENGDPSFTLTGQDKHGLYDGARIRRLTPLECERLQGFPDNWTSLDAEGGVVSDTQRYKMCGNAVTVNVVTEVITALCKGGCLQTEGIAGTLKINRDIEGK